MRFSLALRSVLCLLLVPVSSWALESQLTLESGLLQLRTIFGELKLSEQEQRGISLRLSNEVTQLQQALQRARIEQENSSSNSEQTIGDLQSSSRTASDAQRTSNERLQTALQKVTDAEISLTGARQSLRSLSTSLFWRDALIAGSSLVIGYLVGELVRWIGGFVK